LSRALIAAALAVVAVSAAACTSSGAPSARTGAATSPAPTTSAPASAPSSSSPAPVSSPAAPSTVAVSTSAAPTRSHSVAPTNSPATSTAPSGPPDCTQAQLKLSPVRGGAFQGREIAGVVFTNTSSATCALRGYPAAQLRHKGRNLGQPAINNSGRVRTIVVKPGGAAQVQLTAVTTCQSAISDHVRIQVPGSSTSTDVPMELRGCLLSVNPFEAG
jgi:uncharacterized protein DUF4232